MYPPINQLESRFLEPNGFRWGTFTNGSEARIRYGWIAPNKEPSAVAVLVPGRAAPIEKYFEPIQELFRRGFAVWLWTGADKAVQNATSRTPKRGIH